MTHRMTPQTTHCSHLTREDKDFLGRLTALLESQSAFFLAELASDPRLADRAAAVMTWRDGNFTTVRELFERCASHHWNRQIYEAWAWETVRRIEAIMGLLQPTPARALRTYAESQGLYDVSSGEMSDAIFEAKHAMEGTLLNGALDVDFVATSSSS